MKTGDFDMQGKEDLRGTAGAYMLQPEEGEKIRNHLNPPGGQERDAEESAASRALWEIGCAVRYLEMVLEEPESIRERIGKLKGGMGKRHAASALAAAQERLDAAGEGLARVNALTRKGGKDAAAGFRSGRAGAPGCPFPIIAVEKELKSIMDCLAGAFAALDVGIGRIEEAEGMECREGHYLDLARGGLWEGGAGEQAWLGVLWPMRSLEKLIISAQDAAHCAACSADGMRPKARSTIKKHVLVPGFQWEKEKERERTAASIRSPRRAAYAGGAEREEGLRVAEDVILPGAGGGFWQKNGGGKPSLRKRLEAAGEKSRRMHEEGSLQERKNRAGERQR